MGRYTRCIIITALVAVAGNIILAYLLYTNEPNLYRQRAGISGTGHRLFSLWNGRQDANKELTMEARQETTITSSMTTTTTPEPYDAESEMRRNANYTRHICQLLSGSSMPRLGIGRVEEILIGLRISEERAWFYGGEARAEVSLTWTSETNRRFSLLFTPIPKNGWTTWQTVFYNDAGKLDIIRNESRWAWDNHYRDVGLQKTVIIKAQYHQYKDRLLMVRNPYERLVSAFQDKAVHAEGLYSKRFHAPCTWLTLNHTLSLTFSQFVDCIIENVEAHQQERSGGLSSRQATIWLDMHWTPQSHLAVPCRVDYNLIGKHERFSKNSEFMIERLKLNATLTWENRRNKLNIPLAYWFATLSVEQKLKLYAIYKYDFLLFGFDPSPPGGMRPAQEITTKRWFRS